MNPIPEDKNTQYGYWMPTAIFDKKLNFNREKLLQKFKDNNIDGRVFFYPLSSLPMFEEKRENVVSYDIFERAINFPSYHEIDEYSISKIIDILIGVI